MNSSVYLFGNLSSGYTQYPDEDFSYSIFQTFYQRAKSTTQIVIHRDGCLMYYCYIRKLEQNQYIGLCVLLNDAIIAGFENMFTLYEYAISNLAEKGYLIRYDEYGNLVANAEKLFKKLDEVELVTETLKRGFNNLAKSAQELPPENFAVGRSSAKSFSIEDDVSEILQSSYTNGYTYIYKSKDFETAQMMSYKGVLSRVSKERDEYAKQLIEKKKEITILKAKQRNITWVSILGAVVLILGVILWNKILFPSEVTHYETGEFVYYGPMKNNKPHGTGVAIYPQNDPHGRKYYIGNFINGVRQDSAAILFYQKGDYFYGLMEGDKWEYGLLYKCSDGTYFKGSFQQNIPYNGEWFDHIKKHNSVEGEVVY